MVRRKLSSVVVVTLLAVPETREFISGSGKYSVVPVVDDKSLSMFRLERTTASLDDDGSLMDRVCGGRDVGFRTGRRVGVLAGEGN